MSGWVVDPDCIKQVKILADSMRKDVCDVDDSIMALHFDEVVGEIVGASQNRPCSVDCICASKDNIIFVEFKPYKEEDRDRIDCKFSCKAIESLFMFRTHVLDRDMGMRFIQVSQDNRNVAMAAMTEGCKDKAVPPMLKRYSIRDTMSKPIFFDDVKVMSCFGFTKYANKHLMHSTKDWLMDICCH